MIDRKQLRADPDGLRAALARRDAVLVAPDGPLERALAMDVRQRELKVKLEAMQAERNRVSKLIGQKKARGEDAGEELARMGELARRVKALEAEAREAETAFEQALLEIPNPPHESVPDGMDESDNVEIRRWGEPRQDDVPPHWEIGERLGILDFEAGARIAGSRFTVLRGMGARLERALMQFMLDLHVDRHGYQEVWTPAIVNRKAMTGTGQLPKFADDLYKLEGEEAFLIPTAEVPVTNLYREQVLDADCLPIRHCAYTPCFRREAGSAGKDVRGMIRQHQFDKVELVHLTSPERALDDLKALTSHAEAVLQALELPYRVVELCAGDLGFSAEKTYDLEVWLPGQKAYREISSCSSFGQFQGRRAKIRSRFEMRTSTINQYADIIRSFLNSKENSEENSIENRIKLFIEHHARTPSTKSLYKSALKSWKLYQDSKGNDNIDDWMEWMKNNIKGRPQYISTLNGSGLAIGRTLVAILENGWQEDGSVRLPSALQPYLGGLQVLANA